MGILITLRKGKRKENQGVSAQINDAIRAPQVRVISDDDGNLGVLNTRDAIKKAYDSGMDLVMISPQADPPVAKITDYGKHMYDTKKKAKEVKAKATTLETKSIQVKVGTGEGDLGIKAKRASKWLAEGHRIKVELFLRGRVKYLGKEFHEERLNRILALISEPHKIVDGPKQSPKGIMVTLERDKSKQKQSSEKAPEVVDTVMSPDKK